METVDLNSWWLWAAVIWTLPWKGAALWTAARKSDKWWFIALFLINTLAILEILYVFVFSKRKSLTKPTEPVNV